MKTSEVVFELVLVPFEPVVPGQRKPSGKKPGVIDELDSAGQQYLIRTHVRVRSAGNLLWVVRAVNEKLWGLVGKRRFFLYRLDTEQFYPLFKKREADIGKSHWELNPELIRFFQDELYRLSRKPKQLKLPLDVTREAAESIATVIVNQRSKQPETLTEALEASIPVKDIALKDDGESFYLSQVKKVGYDNRLK